MGIAGGDAFSFNEIFRMHNEKVYAFSLKNLKNREDAEEVVQLHPYISTSILIQSK